MDPRQGEECCELRGGEAASQQGAQVERWCVATKCRQGRGHFFANGHPLHGCAYPRVQKTGQLTVGEIGAGPGGVAVQRIRDEQLIAGAGHRHVQEAPLFVDLRVVIGRARHWEHAVGGVDHEHRVPFLPFRGMHRGQNQGVVFIGAAHREILRVRRRLEGQRREKGAAVGVAGGDHFELIEVGHARRRIIVSGLQDRIVQVAAETDGLGRCVRVVAALHAAHAIQQGGQCLKRRAGA